MAARCPRCRSNSVGDLALVFNGEIYNYLELRRELEAKGHIFHSRTDSEVLLHLYAEHGTDMLQRLNGIFAFAIRDAREARTSTTLHQGDIFIARDQLGVKPFYYAETKEGVLFGSELKALLQHSDLSRTLDHIALHYQLAYLWTPAPRTVLAAIKKLPPGSALILRGGRLHRQWNYYDLPYGRDLLSGSENEIAMELHRRLEVAVARQMVSDVPVGAFLSGGLDSSAVVAMMKRVRPGEEFNCYSIGFADERSVEGNPADMPYARKVATHLGVRLRAIEVGPEVISNLERVLYHLDEPQADPAPINALLIAEQARRDGVKVLLSGAGGDDIFSGYRRHWAVSLEKFWQWMPSGTRGVLAALSRWASGGHGIPVMRSPVFRRAAKLFLHADLSSDVRLASYFWWSGEAMRRSLYAADLAAELAETDTALPLLESLQRIPGERSPLNRMLYLESKHFLPDHNLNYTDKMGMAEGVEVRVPLLDLELVEFAARIPPVMKQKGKVGKAIFKKAMEQDLPREVVYRPKSGFGAPLRRWLREELREQVEDTLSAESLARRNLFDATAVRRIVDLDRAGSIDGAYTIFALMSIELWCRRFLDEVPSSPRHVQAHSHSYDMVRA
jgi:asparagine synthase (glutamine-hydrolysing)